MSSQSTPPPPAPNPKPSSKGWLYGLIALALLIGIVFGSWKLFFQPKPPEVQPKPPEVKEDLIAATHANARAVGLMEQFEYDKAVDAFEEAAKFAPGWIPAKINLGIALLNAYGLEKDPVLKVEKVNRALTIFHEILTTDPNNPYAHYCLGIILRDQGKIAEALPHFEAVTRIDSDDAHAWYYRGICIPNSYAAPVAKECFENALKLNPYLNPARLSLAQHSLIESDARKSELLTEFERFYNSQTDDKLGIVYTEMGKYAEVIGKSPTQPPGLGRLPTFEPVKGLNIKLASGTTWATPDKLDTLRTAVRARFGGTILLLDYNRDGRTDLLLLGAILREGVVGDLLLRNDGNFTFTDVTAEVGLAKHVGSFGGAVGDFDNDTFPDLVLAGPDGLKLFRNAAGKTFENKTALAGLDKEPGVYLSANWVDLDQDGDLDLVAAKYAQSPDLALRQLKGEKVEGHGRVVVFANVGVAPPEEVGKTHLPLSCAFKQLIDKQLAEPEALLVQGPITHLIASDIDGDLDIDLIVLLDGQPPVTVLNDRMLRFHRGERIVSGAANWGGGLVLDANGDDQPDLVLIEPGASPRILVSKRDQPDANFATRFALEPTNSPPLRSATCIDLDLDGRTDIVGLSIDRKPIYLQGSGLGKFSKFNAPFGAKADAIGDLLAAIPCDLDGDGNPDLLAWSEGGGLKVFRNLGNGNNSIRVQVTGKWDKGKNQRSNTDGVGCWVRVHAGPLRTAAENTTLFAGLGQSRLPLHFGIGKADIAEAIRVRWPDAVIQAEINQSIGLVTIMEFNRKPISCPVLFTWDGERFAYITDCLGAASMGESGPDGSARPPRPEESVKIETGQLVAKNGKYTLKLAEPMDEVMYLDRLRLDVIDHPPGMSMFPDERFATSDPQPTQERLFFRDHERIFPTKATDHRGRDVTAILRERDGKHVEGFALRSWMGYAEDHYVELDFNGALKSLPPGRKVYLVLAGWTDYPFPESIYAATQAGVPTIWPVLEQKQSDGSWKTLGEIGIPAGLPRVMTKEITGWIDPSAGPIRIRSNLQVFWDQVFIAPITDVSNASVRELPVSRASLEHRGFAQEYRPGGKLPIAYDYDRLENVSVTRWRGKLTRTGDVTELLTAEDDRFVICGPGDEITSEFDASSLPPLPLGWQRSFVLRTWGYCKDTAPTTLTAGFVGPLPHRAMAQFPYDPVKQPLPPHVVEYDRIWNTRPAGGR